MIFQDSESTHESFLSRVRWATAFISLALIILLSRLVYLQLIIGDELSVRAEKNRISLVPIPPNRGVITDRNGQLLASNYATYVIEIALDQVENVDHTINEVSKLIKITARDRARFKRDRAKNKRFGSIAIRTHLSDKEVAQFAANRFRFKGTKLTTRLIREYPMGETASHVLGYIGRINSKEQALIEQSGKAANYRGTDHIGKTGLEKYYEQVLHGKAGFQRVEVGPNGHAIRLLHQQPAQDGKNLKLALDIGLQRVAEKAFGNRRGALVAIEPDTGGILALVSMPGYDPNLFVDGISVKNWKKINESPDKPLLNRTIQSAYPPGSTFKLFMALAALENNDRTPDQAFRDPGYFRFHNHTFRDDKVGGHGIVNMYKSIVESCDTYYYLLARDMGVDKIAEFMSKFGFGHLSGIDLGNEIKGTLPSKQWKRSHFKNPRQKKWFPGETISIGIGQGYNSYTPIQIARAVSALANQGVMYAPYLVGEIKHTETIPTTKVTRKPFSIPGLHQENLDFIARAMVGVNKLGTGARVFSDAPYSVAGKTGTSQVFSLKGEEYIAENIKQSLRDHSLFVAFAPVEAPKIAMMAIVENGGFGSSAAAPIVRMALDYYLLGKVPKQLQSSLQKEASISSTKLAHDVTSIIGHE